MKKRYCPCCKSTLRSKKPKKKYYRLLFFLEFLTCATCNTFYAYSKGLCTSFCITAGVPKKHTKQQTVL